MARLGGCSGVVRFWLGLVAAVVTLGACGSSPIGEIDGFATVSAVVYGHVTAAGQPVAGATVELDVLKACSDSTSAALLRGTPTSNAEGRFREVLITAVEPFDACVDASFTPPVGEAHAPAIVSGIAVRVRAGSPDSVEISVDLDPRPGGE
jgi:hypothetical protein